MAQSFGVRRSFFVIALMIAAPVTSSAQGVVYDNGQPNNSGVISGDWGFTNGGAPIGLAWKAANDFKITGLTRLTSFDWWALFPGTNGPSPVSASFYWQILSDNVGKPGAVIAEGNVTGALGTQTDFGCCAPLPWEYQGYSFSTSLGSITLGWGKYWLAIGGFDSNYGNDSYYYWANSTTGFGNEAKSWDNSGWKTIRNEGAFTMYGDATSTVPEPATLVLLATGLVGMSGAARRHRKRSQTR
jgi:hypothetical protein